MRMSHQSLVLGNVSPMEGWEYLGFEHLRERGGITIPAFPRATTLRICVRYLLSVRYASILVQAKRPPLYRHFGFQLGGCTTDRRCPLAADRQLGKDVGQQHRIVKSTTPSIIVLVSDSWRNSQSEVHQHQNVSSAGRPGSCVDQRFLLRPWKLVCHSVGPDKIQTFFEIKKSTQPFYALCVN